MASFASAQQINAIVVENRRFQHQSKMDWMNRTAADPLFKFLVTEVGKRKDRILADLAEAAKKEYVPSVCIFSVNECVFTKKPGSREDCRHDPVIAQFMVREPMTVLEYVKEEPGWHDTPSSLIPEEFWQFGHMAPDEQNDFYETLRDSDTLRLLEDYLGNNFSCHVDRKDFRKRNQFTAYKVEVRVQFHLTKRPIWRKQQIDAAVERFKKRQDLLAEDRRMDRWHELNDEDGKLAERLEAIPYPYVGLNAFEVAGIVGRRKAIYAEMYPNDGPEYDQDDINKAVVANRHGF